jgi:hypothetical protein
MRISNKRCRLPSDASFRASLVRELYAFDPYSPDIAVDLCYQLKLIIIYPLSDVDVVSACHTHA